MSVHFQMTAASASPTQARRARLFYRLLKRLGADVQHATHDDVELVCEEKDRELIEQLGQELGVFRAR